MKIGPARVEMNEHRHPNTQRKVGTAYLTRMDANLAMDNECVIYKLTVR